ncbi:hypothetical protein [Halomarina oriensis]|uniref:Uncharacterized protein n=1 Tax=Halomarina oriensis TaxID=671145 RepID=A0A6B0GKK5_9EURY|nr:hypothetical protein [Halomarina oriensis]MWG35392.1 hypothetical protein [Halomarina oriensis]
MPDRPFPYGAIPKIDPSNSPHRELFSNHPSAPFLLTKFSNAIWLEKRPEELQALLGPHQRLIVANVEQDEELKGRTPDDEMDLVKGLQPAYYIPSDRWVYEDTMTDAEQLAEIDRCMSGTREVYERITGHDELSTTVIPIVKGWKQWHLERCRRTLDDLGLSYCAFDVTQYNTHDMILGDVRRLIEVIAPEGILLIGRLDPRVLRKCPPEVVAATGVYNWLNKSQTESGRLSRENFRVWAAEENEVFRSSQTGLHQFEDHSHVRIHG